MLDVPPLAIAVTNDVGEVRLETISPFGVDRNDPSRAELMRELFQVLSIFVRGKGITCEASPPGYTLQGRTTDSDGVGKDMYAVYAPTS